MFADIVKIISLNNLSKNAQYVIFGGTIIVDEPICKKELSEQIYDFTECVDNWVIKDNYEKIDHQNNHKYI